jgi:transketolase
VAVEAGIRMGWERFVGDAGEVIGIDHYGASAPGAKLFEEYGFTVENVLSAARRTMDAGR